MKELLTNLPKEEVSDPTFNNNIRNICRKAGITEAVKVFKAGKEVEGEKWEFVSSHTARRSFATNLYLRGVRFILNKPNDGTCKRGNDSKLSLLWSP
ncbi:hypothetical protein NXY15_24270 [Bacteroides thetaiotaomicron]|nr:hypothetical protein NXY15_24270 [Bacteroides thetaiotaomicron]